ncbi:class I ribonucleotide reductase maintenance protein YfaE [Paraglaciecola aquimarina]|uniref:Class I ribonucleotide reductase maintenance protein YfaE n=1 Tax=Paraglaciecola algarum TaxID=3050085 RepID=A0ABS9D5C9_9ALTE|nr:class I ribonucleotide reductase maintenance protein YfaE [Paraglaciecola sp. G1-23]MCF2947019.1 class I ribonucleotide reductase maintenance protein YfaE [Paraglaciecola sp. G1-23]
MNIKTHTKNGTYNVPFFDGDTILQSIERKEVEVQSHCRDGFCGACRCKLKSGQVEYKVDPLAFINDDEILTCCTIPITNIEIEFD